MQHTPAIRYVAVGYELTTAKCARLEKIWTWLRSRADRVPSLTTPITDRPNPRPPRSEEITWSDVPKPSVAPATTERSVRQGTGDGGKIRQYTLT